MVARSALTYVALAMCVSLLAAGAGSRASAQGELRAPLSVEWVFSLEADPGNTTTPVVQGDRVYFMHLGVVRCLDARTGAEQWNFSVPPAAVVTSPVLWEDLVIVGATDKRLYGLRAATGEKVWEMGCVGPISPDPLILEGELFVGAERMVYAIAPRTGKPSWVCSLTSSAKTGPVTDGSMLYFLCQDGSVQCVDAAAGRYRWRQTYRAGPETFAPVVGARRAIIATGDRVYGIARSSSIAYTAELPAGIAGRPTLVDEVLYVPCVDGQIYTLRARSGARAYEGNFMVDAAVTAPPLVTNTAVVAGTGTGLLCLLDRDTGRLLWSYRCLTPEQEAGDAAEFGIYAPIVAGEGSSFYCLTGTGDLYRFSGTAPDAAGPRFAELKPDPGSALPGGDYLELTVAVVDSGSGVDPVSVRATVDGRPVEVEFDAVSGLATLRPLSLADGAHVVKVTARDYRGNEGSGEWSFVTDASLAPPPEERPDARTGLTTRTLGR